MEDKEQNSKNGHTYRATWKDYSEPTIYLLTMNTEDRQPLLGELIGEKIVLSAYGEVVSEEIKRIPTYKDASAIQIYRYVVMPNHIHILLRVHEQLWNTSCSTLTKRPIAIAHISWKINGLRVSMQYWQRLQLMLPNSIIPSFNANKTHYLKTNG